MNREKILLSDKWKFHLGENTGAWYMGFDDGDWQEVTVPHDWAVKNPFSKDNSSGTGYVCGGTGWYRRSFGLRDIKGKKVYITFEGIYNNSQIWINSNYMGKRPYGYATFTHDITEFVREGENVVCVKVNHNDIADSRWYTGSGIVRPVYLTITDEAAAVPDGIKITTPLISSSGAVVVVETQTTMEGLTVANTVIDRFGRSVAGCEGGQVEISNPMLWSPEHPNLYTLKTDVFRDGELTDTVETRFGIRKIRFDADKGFFLNGENMKIKGVCLHHDGGCLGAAVPKSVWRNRLETLKECGCNAIRTSHNPPDPALLDLCDEMGFLVMDEAFDEWEGPKNKWWQGHNVYPPKHYGYYEDFHEWGEKDIKMMVRRDRNHPSIVMWSIGNEVDYPNDPYVHPLFDEVMGNNDANKPARERMYDPKRPDASRLAKIAEKLVKWVKEEDDTRPVTAALAFPELSNETGYADALDIVGYNYKEQFYEQDHKRFKDRVIFGSENGHHPGAWKAVKENDYICGQFLWTGIDYMGEAHGWPVRCSGAGLLDMAGFKKLRFYQRKAMWSDEPSASLACRRPPEFDAEHNRPRFAPFEMKWNWNEGEEIEVACFTNQEDCELFLNGESMGKGEAEPRMGAVIWKVSYTAGELKAVCGEAEARLATAGAAEKIHVRTLKNVDDDVIRLEISLSDKDGNLAAEDMEVSVAVIGGELMGLENGNIADCTSYTSGSRSTLNGRL
ncbi:MAG: glycoside hydrolase family 2 TIM barrel-domain containing protein, partial [Clostridia bacterium]